MEESAGVVSMVNNSIDIHRGIIINHYVEKF